MTYINPPQFISNGLSEQYRTRSASQPLRGVRQDNPAHPPASSATPEPAPLPNHRSAELLNRKTHRTQNRRRYRKSAVKITSWVKPVIKEEIEKLAKGEGLSLSALSASLLEKALQQSLYIRYAALIDPIIEKAIGKHMRGYSDRNAALQVRNLIKTELILGLVTNILGRQPGMDETIMRDIMHDADDAARASITRTTPQQKTIVDAEKMQFDEKGGKVSD